MKHIGVSLEAKDDDFDNNMFYIPPNYPLKPIYVELEAHMVVDHGKRHFVWLSFEDLWSSSISSF